MASSGAPAPDSDLIENKFGHEWWLFCFMDLYELIITYRLINTLSPGLFYFNLQLSIWEIITNNPFIYQFICAPFCKVLVLFTTLRYQIGHGIQKDLAIPFPSPPPHVALSVQESECDLLSLGLACARS